MKAISLRYYKTPDKTSVYLKAKEYSVFLFWGKTVRFSDRKRLLAFLAAASRVLTDSYCELAYMLGDAVKEAIATYLMLNIKDKQQCWIYIAEARKAIEFIPTKSGDGANDCTFIVQSLIGCIASINSIYKECENTYIEKKSFTDLKRVRLAMLRLSEIKKRIESLDTLAEME